MKTEETKTAIIIGYDPRDRMNGQNELEGALMAASPQAIVLPYSEEDFFTFNDNIAKVKNEITSKVKGVNEQNLDDILSNISDVAMPFGIKAAHEYSELFNTELVFALPPTPYTLSFSIAYSLLRDFRDETIESQAIENDAVWHINNELNRKYGTQEAKPEQEWNYFTSQKGVRDTTIKNIVRDYIIDPIPKRNRQKVKNIAQQVKTVYDRVAVVTEMKELAESYGTLYNVLKKDFTRTPVF